MDVADAKYGRDSTEADRDLCRLALSAGGRILSAKEMLR